MRAKPTFQDGRLLRAAASASERKKVRAEEVKDAYLWIGKWRMLFELWKCARG